MYDTLIVGLGQIGMGYDISISKNSQIYSHARALSCHPEFNLFLPVEPDKYLTDLFHNIYNSPVYNDLEALSNHKIDVALISSTTSTHYHLLRSLLTLSEPKLILCEKPLSYS